MSVVVGVLRELARNAIKSRRIAFSRGVLFKVLCQMRERQARQSLVAFFFSFRTTKKNEMESDRSPRARLNGLNDIISTNDHFSTTNDHREIFVLLIVPLRVWQGQTLRPQGQGHLRDPGSGGPASPGEVHDGRCAE